MWEGTLSKRSTEKVGVEKGAFRKNWKTRWIVLHANSTLSWYKQQGATALGSLVLAPTASEASWRADNCLCVRSGLTELLLKGQKADLIALKEQLAALGIQISGSIKSVVATPSDAATAPAPPATVDVAAAAELKSPSKSPRLRVEGRLAEAEEALATARAAAERAESLASGALAQLNALKGELEKQRAAASAAAQGQAEFAAQLSRMQSELDRERAVTAAAASASVSSSVGTEAAVAAAFAQAEANAAAAVASSLERERTLSAKLLRAEADREAARRSSEVALAAEREAASTRENRLRTQLREMELELSKDRAHAQAQASATKAQANAAMVVEAPQSSAAAPPARPRSSAAPPARPLASTQQAPVATPQATSLPPAPPPTVPPSTAPSRSSTAHSFTVGARVLAIAPVDSDDEEEEPAAERWVPGRVLGQRVFRGKPQHKVSLDGYDSEDDVWVDNDDPRVRPYDADGATTGAAGDDKSGAAKEAAERDHARRFAEQRKLDARSVHAAAQ